MSSSIPEAGRRAAVVTVSDSRARGDAADLSGPAIAQALREAGFQVAAEQIVPDEQPQIEHLLIELASRAEFIVTTGGTGIATRDVTPEATRAVCGRILDGVAEEMRRAGREKTPYAVLSRGVCGVRGKIIILNVPGNPRGAVDALASVLDLVPHILDLLQGKTGH